MKTVCATSEVKNSGTTLFSIRRVIEKWPAGADAQAGIPKAQPRRDYPMLGAFLVNDWIDLIRSFKTPTTQRRTVFASGSANAT
jgi:hypothetical protein